MKRTKRKNFKFISFYQHKIDDPVILIFDTKKEALAEARGDVKDVLGQAGEEPERIREILEEFDREERADIEGCVIYVAKYEYRPSAGRTQKQRTNNQARR
jgi:hypothetical protein